MPTNNTSIELTRRRLMSGIAVTGITVAGAGAGTWAALSDTERSTDNTIQAGTLDLQDDVDFTWEINNAIPGDGQTSQLNLSFSNGGSLAADHLELAFDHTPREDADGDLSTTDSGPESDTLDGASGMAEYVRVDYLTYTDTGKTVIDLLLQIDDANGNGIKDLDDLTAAVNADVLDDLDTPEKNNGRETGLTIDVTVDSSMPNDYQGDVLQTTLSATLNQAETQ